MKDILFLDKKKPVKASVRKISGYTMRIYEPEPQKIMIAAGQL